MTKNRHVWEDIPNYEGLYKVNELSDIINVQRNKYLSSYITKKGYVNVKLSKNNKRTTYGVHQLVAMAFLNHVPDGMNKVINHINMNKLDNRKVNLEIISNRANTTKTHLKSTSKYTGVSFNKRNKNWFSCISIDGKTIYLGSFNNEEDAHKAYNNYLIKLKEND